MFVGAGTRPAPTKEAKYLRQRPSREFALGAVDLQKLEKCPRLKQLEAAQHFADDLDVGQRHLFVAVVRIVGNDFHPGRL
jgi:hypothetical protein